MASDRPVPRFDKQHHLDEDQFDQIAAGHGDPATIEMLFGGETSRRLLLLWKLLRYMEESGGSGPLPSAADAWNLLSAVEKRSRVALTATIMYPAVGTWLSRVLRLIRRGESGPIPTAVYAGQIHAVAFAAAVRAGVECETALPVVNGDVMLPTLGLARFPDCPGWTVARGRYGSRRASVTCGDITVTLPPEPSEEASGWWGLRTIVAPDDRLRVVLDDIDPHRNLADPVPPDRLSDREFDSWRQSVCRASTLLARTWPAYSASIGSGLEVITPLSDDTGVVRSASTGDAFGAAVMTFTNDESALACTLVHEFQHIKLGAVIHLVTLHDEDSPNDMYAPWRPDPRPFGGLFQGIYAFLGIAEFWHRQRNSADAISARIAEFEFAYARRQLSAALRSISGSPRLTPLGQRFVDGMRDSNRRLHSVPVSRAAARAAWAAAVDHRATWLLRNVVPDPDLVSSLAARWRDQRPPLARLVGGSLAPDASDTSGEWVNARHTLYRMRLSASRRYRNAREGSEDVSSIVRGATEADIALFEGDPEALAAYLGQIRQGPAPSAHRDDERWAGLALAAAATGAPSWRTLCHRPHLVRAVHRALADAGADPDPIALADWLGRATSPTVA